MVATTMGMAATRKGMGMTKVCSRCPVCFGGMGHGQAIFTAECSRTFHLRCVPRQSVCPVCAGVTPPSNP